jgi:hypothetical protein
LSALFTGLVVVGGVVMLLPLYYWKVNKNSREKKDFVTSDDPLHVDT